MVRNEGDLKQKTKAYLESRVETRGTKSSERIMVGKDLRSRIEKAIGIGTEIKEGLKDSMLGSMEVCKQEI
ncbi:hypothetical protein NDU88_006904 [Pleurodeles waltl]|uniref:Uncharacterized protein n=1 Tax=Pleurodeles waltl TaxID=8319 RepID=A0AAV7SQV2_PLEWA|nr:hypothetical protein NDU88_006904 [Pleurodeles waltl]